MRLPPARIPQMPPMPTPVPFAEQSLSSLNLQQTVWMSVFTAAVGCGAHTVMRHGESVADRMEMYASMADVALPVAMARLKELA